MYDSDYHDLEDEDSPLVCKHGYVPAKFVAFEGRNAGRRFLRCQEHRAMMQGGSCGFVKWVCRVAQIDAENAGQTLGNDC